MAVGGFFWKRSLGGERDIRRSPLGSGNANGYHGGLPGAASGKVGIYSVDMKRGQAEVYFVSGD